MTYEQKVWNELISFIHNPLGVAGLMGNIKAESGCRPDNLQDSYNRKLNMTDLEYTEAVDDGSYTREQFISDGAGYGLCQWTYKEHKAQMWDAAQRMRMSIGDPDFQIMFLKEDLERFSSVLNVLKTAGSVREASDDVLLRYEKPTDTSESMKEKRERMGLEILERYVDPEELEELMNSKDMIVIESAKSRIGDPYVFGARGEDCNPANRRKYDTNTYPEIINTCKVLSGRGTCGDCEFNGRHIYDCRGFTYRCMLDAGISIQGAGATTQWQTASNWMDSGTTDDMPDAVCCLFKKVNSKMSHTGLHIGGGKIIHCSGTVKTDTINNRTWTHWAVPIGLYTEEELSKKERIRAMSSLKKGSKGTAVKELQEMLNKLGYNCGEPDGSYGTNTEKAVRKFQAANGLTVDGIAGTKTRTAIEKAASGITVIEPQKPQVDLTTRVADLEDRVRKLEEKIK